jgi:MbtH protein
MQKEYTMSNPFENPDGISSVLVNSEGQFSLWPAFIEISSGWDIAFDHNIRQECLGYIDDCWV